MNIYVIREYCVHVCRVQMCVSISLTVFVAMLVCIGVSVHEGKCLRKY